MKLGSMPENGESTYTGPAVTFWDSEDGAVTLAGHSFTRTEFQQVIDRFTEVNMRHHAMLIERAAKQPIGICHDSRPNRPHRHKPYMAPEGRVIG